MAADHVPETRDLDGDDAWSTLKRVRYLPLARESIERFREASGMAYARAIGFQIVLATLPAIIFFVAFASWTDIDTVRNAIEGVVTSLAPGSSGFLEDAVNQGEQSGGRNLAPLVFGGLAAIVSGAAGMGQFIEVSSRIYGIEQGRSVWKIYGIGVMLTLTVGVLMAGAPVAISFGSTIAESVAGDSVWAWVRWPLATVGLVIALSALYVVAPGRNQPRISWLLVGGVTATALWLLLSGGLALYLALSSTFEQTYGSIAGLIGLALWAQLTGIAVILGLCFAAELEAERAGAESTTEEVSADGRRESEPAPLR